MTINLSQTDWTPTLVTAMHDYLNTLAKPAKIDWSIKIINTQLPVLAIPSPVLKKISQTIAQGNYQSFLDLMPWQSYEETIINASLISKIKDFATYRHYLDRFGVQVDNWASCDVLTFPVKSKVPR